MNPINAESLRNTYQAALAPQAGECPDREELAALAMDDVQPPRRELLADHVTRCALCLDDYRLLRELHGAASRRPRRAPRIQPRFVALAASVVAAAALALMLGTSDGPVPADGGAMRASTEAVQPGDGDTLARAPAELRWSPAPAAGAQTARLYDDQAILVYEAAAARREGRVVLPPQVQGRLGAGGTYFWTVEEGTRLRGPYWFTVEPD